MALTIGITDTETRYENYPKWIKGHDSEVRIIQLSPENKNELDRCDGIVLSGGIDAHPKFYNSQKLDYPLAPKKFNEARDEFEISVFNYAQKHNIPVLAICRGMQLVNIALGGTLIQDIQESGKKDHRSHDGTDGIHEITITKDSLLFEISGHEKETINSSHHQALSAVAPELKITAYSPDGIAEAAEWKNKNNKPFLLCVQWHPERLAILRPDSAFSNNIRKKFLETIENKKS